MYNADQLSIEELTDQLKRMSKDAQRYQVLKAKGVITCDVDTNLAPSDPMQITPANHIQWLVKFVAPSSTTRFNLDDLVDDIIHQQNASASLPTTPSALDKIVSYVHKHDEFKHIILVKDYSTKQILINEFNKLGTRCYASRVPLDRSRVHSLVSGLKHWISPSVLIMKHEDWQLLPPHVLHDQSIKIHEVPPLPEGEKNGRK